ncbi:hypothetical protein HDIA_2244 [Hartmannibacter diazotrophicus]|uniref:Uncharacterized protein n=1 Tax=Hartmannibacter diazotrophicus TaxID=1482074 RepID=A0A2C9D8A9_9HYPH|nr:hypothetical protein [Hartmannibacter diazotrophicus]SON55785.1 hypothetical protein HDIA_2244 [Hartmannibacter diazotrophicus]
MTTYTAAQVAALGALKTHWALAAGEDGYPVPRGGFVSRRTMRGLATRGLVLFTDNDKAALSGAGERLLSGQRPYTPRQ